MHAEITFDLTKTFGSVLKKIRAIFRILFDKIQGSLQKYHILMLNVCFD